MHWLITEGRGSAPALPGRTAGEISDAREWAGRRHAIGGSRTRGSGIRRRPSLEVAIFGSAPVSAHWSGAAACYQGVLEALHNRGHRITFYVSDASGRPRRGDLTSPRWAHVVVYPCTEAETLRQVQAACCADVVLKIRGAGAHEELLEGCIPGLASRRTTTVFWDLDAPATLGAIEADPGDPMRALLPRFDVILTCGGGDAPVRRYAALGARTCVPISSAFDPDVHYPTVRDARFECDLAYFRNRLPDREPRMEELFLGAARLLPERGFLLGGSGWEDKPMPANVRSVGHVYAGDRNTFNSTALAVLDIGRESAWSARHLPAARLFEGAAAGACVITDDWDGLEVFFEPGEEILVARTAEEIAGHLGGLDRARAEGIGQRARRRVLAEHTYERRAAQLEAALTGCCARIDRPALRA